MFLQSNAEHIPSFEGGGEEVGERKEEGDDIKDRLIFCAICWLVLSLPSHYIMSEIVNKQITTAHQRARRGSSTPSFSGGLSGKKTFVFTVHFNNISHFYLYRQKERKKKELHEDLYEPLSPNWPSIYGTCHSQDAEVPSQLFMARLPIMAHHSLNGIQPFTSECRPVPFFFQIEAVSPAEHAGEGCY